MIVFLTSSPCVYQAPRAIINPENSFLVNLLSCLPENPRCLFVASAPDDPEFTDRVAEEMSWALELAGMDLSQVTTLDRRTQDEAAELIADSDFIVLCGGHVPTQNAFFQEIGLRELLEDFDGTVMGISAGSMNLAEEVYVQPEEEGEGIAPDFARFAPGLGLTDVNILPHYQKVKDNILDGLRLFEDITYPDSQGNTFFALPDGSYFYQNDDTLLLFGEAYLLRDGELSQLTRSGDCLDMADFE